MNSRQIKITLIIIPLILLAGLGVAYKIIYKSHVPISEQEAIFRGTAEGFAVEVEANPTRLQNKVVILEGKVSSLDSVHFVINAIIFCQPLDMNLHKQLKKNTLVKIKGRFIGYDELFGEIKLDKCIAVE